MKINEISIREDFFKLYPEAKNYFSELSSLEMWALVLFVLPSSPYRKLLTEEREKAIELLFKEKVNWEKILKFKDSFINVTMSKSQRFLLIWEEELEKRLNFIRSIDYSTGGPGLVELKEKMMARTHSIWKQYEEWLKSVNNEENSTLVGEGQESASDSGSI